MNRKILLSTILVLFYCVACERYEPQPIPPNPLEDLPWLKAKIDELSQSGDTISVYIYQCTYRDNDTGFLIDEGNTETFYNYDGEVLCIINEDTKETCSELNIVRKKIIWELNISDCGCSYLQNTAWKLVGMVDVQIGDITELNGSGPRAWGESFTLFFDTNDYFYFAEYVPEFSIYFHGTTVCNFMHGTIDTFSCSMSNVGGTRTADCYDGPLYYNIMMKHRPSPCLQGNVLKFYYNNKQSYLLYKPYSHE